ncbi:MAG: tripartite tricarboxylate transporter substrate binding protein [Cytophagales bacterium]|nr:tripartite tricarboxylate transporter substrate binding protein [Cytophagales bacterium]
MKKLISIIAASLILLGLQQAMAQNAQPAWPSKTLRFLVAAPAGSSLDVIARSMSEKLSLRLGQSIVIENVAGGSGTIATNMAAKAAPDGHTFVLSFNGPLAFTQFISKLPYDPAKDLSAVIMTTSQPNILAINASLPVNSTQELVTYLRSHPAKFNYASVGVGSSSHLAMELFKSEANIFATHIPYNGSPPATFSVASGDTQMIFTIPTIIMPQVKAGKMRALAVSSPKRFSILPDIPTVRESGVKELAQFEALAWNGILVPSATPKAVIERMNREFDAVLKDEAVRTKLAAAGLDVVGGSSDYFTQYLKAETSKWQIIINRLGIRQE